MRLVALSILLLAVAVLVIGWRATRAPTPATGCTPTYGDYATCNH